MLPVILKILFQFSLFVMIYGLVYIIISVFLLFLFYIILHERCTLLFMIRFLASIYCHKIIYFNVAKAIILAKDSISLSCSDDNNGLDDGFGGLSRANTQVRPYGNMLVGLDCFVA